MCKIRREFWHKNGNIRKSVTILCNWRKTWKSACRASQGCKGIVRVRWWLKWIGYEVGREDIPAYIRKNILKRHFFVLTRCDTRLCKCVNGQKWHSWSYCGKEAIHQVLNIVTRSRPLNEKSVVGSCHCIDRSWRHKYRSDYGKLWARPRQSFY